MSFIILDNVEVIECRLYVRTFFFKSLLKIRVHVGGYSFNAFLPFETDVLNEVITDLLSLAVGNPEDVAGLYVNELGGVMVAMMEFKLVDTKTLCLPLCFDEFEPL